MGLTGSAAILFGIVLFIAPGDGALVLLGLIAAFSLVLGIGELAVDGRAAPGRARRNAGRQPCNSVARRTDPDDACAPACPGARFRLSARGPASLWRRTTLLPVSASGEHALHAGSGMAGHYVFTRRSAGRPAADSHAQRGRQRRASRPRRQRRARAAAGCEGSGAGASASRRDQHFLLVATHVVIRLIAMSRDVSTDSSLARYAP